MVALLKHVGTADWDRDCSEEGDRDAVWAGSLARVNTFKCFTHVGCGEGEPAGFGSRTCQRDCIVLKASKEVV